MNQLTETPISSMGRRWSSRFSSWHAAFLLLVGLAVGLSIAFGFNEGMILCPDADFFRSTPGFSA